MAIMNKIQRLCYISGLLILSSYYQEVYAANRALIIGNSQYTHMNTLTNPVNDADAINYTLKKLGFQTTVIKDAPKRKMLEAIDRFSQDIGTGDTIIFFYAGHGASINGNNYLIPSTASLPEKDIFFDEEFIDLDSKIARRLSNSPASYKIMIMDACRDNPVAQTRSTGTRALARMDTSPNAAGLSILYSASKGQKADDGIGQSNSPFTLSLLKYLNTPNLPWATLVEDVTNDVAKQTKRQQQVWQEGSPLARLVLNNQIALTQNSKPSLPSQVDIELIFWDSIKNETDARSYQAYLQQYPNGRFKVLAQARIQKYYPGYTTVVYGDTTKNQSKPRIHAVVVGINDYGQHNLNLRYAVSDAQSVYQKIKNQVGNLYEKGDLILLTTFDQTKKNSIQDALLKMRQKVKSEDIFVFYFGGQSEYYPNTDLYLVPSDITGISPGQIEKDAISSRELQNLLVQIPADQKLVFIDGTTAQDQLTAQIMAERIQQTTGASVFTPVGVPIESPKFNGGIFTYTFLQALAGHADQDNNGFVDSKELASFIKKVYPEKIKEEFGKAEMPAISLGHQNLQFKVN